MKQYDVISVKNDIPKNNLKKGMKGTIVLVFDDPQLAYEVEFSDESGETIDTVVLYPDQVELIWES